MIKFKFFKSIRIMSKNDELILSSKPSPKDTLTKKELKYAASILKDKIMDRYVGDGTHTFTVPFDSFKLIVTVKVKIKTILLNTHTIDGVTYNEYDGELEKFILEDACIEQVIDGETVITDLSNPYDLYLAISKLIDK